MLSNTEAKLKEAVLIKACILSVFARTIIDSETTFKWFCENKTIVKLDKFKAIVVSKNNSDFIKSEV